MPTLCDLPSEILILISRNHDNILDAIRVSSTCRRLRDLWMEHFDFLHESILRRQIPCYDEASRLIEAQEQARTSEKVHDAFAKVLVPVEPSYTRRARQHLRNAHLADQICDVIMVERVTCINSGVEPTPHETDCCRAHPLHGLPHERERVVHSVYYLQCFALAQQDSSLRAQYEAEITIMGETQSAMLLASLTCLLFVTKSAQLFLFSSA